MRSAIVALGAGLALLGAASPATGQVAWESPLFVAPGSPAGWAVYLVDPAPGDGIGVLTSWRGRAAPGGLGYRIGLAEGRGDELTVYGGIDVSGMLIRATEDFPLNGAWVSGAGLGVGDNVLLSFPLGLSLGRDFETEGIWFNPYFAPRVVLDAWLGGDRPRRSLDLRLGVDLGFDMSFDPGWAIRFGWTVADRSALGIGISFRLL
jgi:hypothetical protein